MATQYTKEELREILIRQRRRQAEVDQRRKEKRRKQTIKRLIIIGCSFLVVLSLVITLLVFGIRGITKAVKNHNTQKAEKAAQRELEIKVDTEPIPDENIIEVKLPGKESASKTGIDENADGGTASDSEIQAEDISNSEARDDITQSEHSMIGDIPVYKGYAVTKSEATEEIYSEEVQSSYAILLDCETGEAVCQKGGFERINPASMTKVLTLLVAVENMSPEQISSDVMISVEDTDYAFAHGLSAAGFMPDEVVTGKDLLYGTILPSGADAAVALARFSKGDIEAFVDAMNDKVEELGLRDTHMTNCVGMYDENHYSTCADMAVIMKAALENPVCYEILKEHIYTTGKSMAHPSGIELSNWFLRRIEDKDIGGEVLCAKTGYVNESGSCAVSFAVKQDGHPFICVTAQAHSAWRCIYDHVEIYKNLI